MKLLNIEDARMRDMAERGVIAIDNIECKYGNAYNNYEGAAIDIFDEVEERLQELGYQFEVVNKDWIKSRVNHININMEIVLG